MTAPYILRAIRKSYGQRVALELEEAVFYPGHLYVLTGPNGSGKSTLLNMLALLLKPEQGQLFFGDEEVTWSKAQLTALRKKITLVHQTPYLFTGSVSANVAYGLKLRGLRGEQVRERVTESLKQVGLEGFERRNAHQVSGGEGRRVALARALALQPEVLLLDEPLANLDQASAIIFERLISSLPKQGTLVVVSTHDPRHAEQLGTAGIHLVNGRVDSQATRYEEYSVRTDDENKIVCQPLTRPAT